MGTKVRVLRITHSVTECAHNHPSTSTCLWTVCGGDLRWGERFVGTRSWWNIAMGYLPDEIWAKILGMGVDQGLEYQDLCSLAFVCRRIRKISSLDCVWRPLWERDQVELGGGPATRTSGAELGAPRKDDELKNFRELFRIRFEEVKQAKMAAHRRRVLRVESQVAVLQKEAQQYELAIKVERRKLFACVPEPKSVDPAWHIAVAQVWQPQAVRARQQELLVQHSVNVGAPQRCLQMEINVRCERVQQFKKSLQARRSAIEKARRELEALTFNPSCRLHDRSIADERAQRQAP